MIHKMGLAVCRKTIVGNSFVHGLSGKESTKDPCNHMYRKRYQSTHVMRTIVTEIVHAS